MQRSIPRYNSYNGSLSGGGCMRKMCPQINEVVHLGSMWEGFMSLYKLENTSTGSQFIGFPVTLPETKSSHLKIGEAPRGN